MSQCPSEKSLGHTTVRCEQVEGHLGMHRVDGVQMEAGAGKVPVIWGIAEQPAIPLTPEN